MHTAPLRTHRSTVPPRSGRNASTSPMCCGCIPPVLMPRTVKLHGRMDPLIIRSVERTT